MNEIRKNETIIIFIIILSQSFILPRKNNWEDYGS